MSVSLSLLVLSGMSYAVAFATHLLSFLGLVREERHRWAFAWMRIGFLLGTFYFVAEAIMHGSFLPVVNFSQASAFFAWSLAFVYLALLVRVQSDSFGLILTPILLIFVVVSCLSSSSGQEQGSSLAAPLLSPYFVVHIVSAFFAYASFTLSFAAGLLYLIQYRELKTRHAGRFYHKLPSLEELERLIHQPLLWGAPLLFAAVGIGFLWSKVAYGEYWLFDPKAIASTGIAVVYGVILYLRYVSLLRGKQVAVMSLVAFAFVLFSFVGTRFLAGSHHFVQ